MAVKDDTFLKAIFNLETGMLHVVRIGEPGLNSRGFSNIFLDVQIPTKLVSPG